MKKNFFVVKNVKKTKKNKKIKHEIKQNSFFVDEKAILG